MDTNVELLRQSTKLLEYFALRNGRVFDRQQASQVMFESHLNESSKPFEDWLDTVVSCSEAMELRIRRIESPLIDVLPLVRSGYPVAVLVDEEGSQNWLVLSKIQGQRLNIVELSSGKTHWIKRAEFAKRLRASNIDNTLSWLVSYPILIGDASGTPISHHDNGHEHHNLVPPLRRLMGILRPEMKDIWTVFIFSMVVGLLTLTTPIAVEALVNTVAFGQFIQPVVILAIIVFVFLAFSSALSALTIYASEIIERRLFVRVVDDLAYRLPRVDQSVNDRQSMHELVNRFLEVITLQKSVSKLLLEGVAVVMKTAIGMLVLAFYHPFLLGYDILLLCLLAFALFVLGRGGVNTAINESVAKYRVLAWLEELSKNPTAFKLNDGMEFALDEADQLSGEYLVARKQHFRIYMRQVLFLLGIYCVATTALLGIGGALVIGGELSLGQLVAPELIGILVLCSFSKICSLI
ncbi:MAG TPA: hypothetical protein PKA76_01365, partial [Pirellulaceae bacterium]|nr:hypothetical protein [Pirellulaceae bacterium]